MLILISVMSRECCAIFILETLMHFKFLLVRNATSLQHVDGHGFPQSLLSANYHDILGKECGMDFSYYFRV